MRDIHEVPGFVLFCPQRVVSMRILKAIQSDGEWRIPGRLASRCI